MADYKTAHELEVELYDGAGERITLRGWASLPKLSGITGQYDSATGYYRAPIIVKDALGNVLDVKLGERSVPKLEMAVKCGILSSPNKGVVEDFIAGTGAYSTSVSTTSGGARTLHMDLRLKGNKAGQADTVETYRDLVVGECSREVTAEGVIYTFAAEITGGIGRS